VSFLLTGDIEAKVSARCWTTAFDLQATVLKVAHHGSATSSSAAFLDAVRPQFAVVVVRARQPVPAIRRPTSSRGSTITPTSTTPPSPAP